uniref:U-scoloptoxin(15)-Ssm2a n=1 Tax=Scolopendra mutilans TaxID=2836329 RepID=TXF2A_SCOMU|nr:RecName: Full=U-scoloptoxin(15)-Ssm2a; Short=U-SLPTX(15)-Ssm2a; AltName: Full=Scolotoxin-Ssm2a; Flags: Precursor [Scolopendra mutilans]AHA82508.1 scolotoxin-Ssm2a [Scolopendra subspinipes]
MEKKIIFLCFFVSLLTLPEFISSQVLVEDDVPFPEKKFADRGECIRACAAKFTDGDLSKIKDVLPRYYKCVCWYYPTS